MLASEIKKAVAFPYILTNVRFFFFVIYMVSLNDISDYRTHTKQRPLLK